MPTQPRARVLVVSSARDHTAARMGALTAVVGCLVALYTAGVVVPYLANGLHHLPVSEVTSGAHDPKDLWPTTEGAWGSHLRSAGLLGALGLVLVAPVSAVLLAASVWEDRRRSRRVERGVLLALVACTAATAVALSPLTVWAAD